MDEILKKILLEYPSGYEFSLAELYRRLPQIPEADLRRVINAHTRSSAPNPPKGHMPIFHRVGARRYRVQLTPEMIRTLFGDSG